MEWLFRLSEPLRQQLQRQMEYQEKLEAYQPCLRARERSLAKAQASETFLCTLHAEQSGHSRLLTACDSWGRVATQEALERPLTRMGQLLYGHKEAYLREKWRADVASSQYQLNYAQV